MPLLVFTVITAPAINQWSNADKLLKRCWLAMRGHGRLI